MTNNELIAEFMPNMTKSYVIRFMYKGFEHNLTIHPEESDWWTAFESNGYVFDVHQDEDYEHIVVYEGKLKGILAYTEEELVSVDYMGCSASSTVDAKLTNKIGKAVKVVSWYDNEAGFSNRVLDLAKYIGAKL